MKKFRASMEPFWDLKIGEYAEYTYLMHVSDEYIFFVYNISRFIIAKDAQ
jgi:hypothetical protein